MWLYVMILTPVIAFFVRKWILTIPINDDDGVSPDAPAKLQKVRWTGNHVATVVATFDLSSQGKADDAAISRADPTDTHLGAGVCAKATRLPRAGSIAA
jgi:hypothetical protein